MVVLGSFYSWISKYSWMSHLQSATKQDVHIPIVPDHYTEWTMHISRNTSEEMKEVALSLDALRRYNNPSQMTQLQELFLSRRNLERNLYWIHVWENVIIKTFLNVISLWLSSLDLHLCILELCVVFIHKHWLYI